MTMKYTEEENAALDEKAAKPATVVICPRCGKELAYRAVGNSYEVKCPTEDCLKETVRGL